jgi:hypothetical protein
MVCTSLYTTRKNHVQYCKHGYELTTVSTELNSYNYTLLGLTHCTAATTLYSRFPLHFLQQLHLSLCTAATFATLYNGYHLHFVQLLPSPILRFTRTAASLSFPTLYNSTFFPLQAVKQLPSQPLGTAAPLSQAVQCTAAILSSHSCAAATLSPNSVQKLLPPIPRCTATVLTSPTLHRCSPLLSSTLHQLPSPLS